MFLYSCSFKKLEYDHVRFNKKLSIKQYCSFSPSELKKILDFLEFPLDQIRFGCTFDNPDGEYRRMPSHEKRPLPYNRHQVKKWKTFYCYFSLQVVFYLVIKEGLMKEKML